MTREEIKNEIRQPSKVLTVEEAAKHNYKQKFNYELFNIEPDNRLIPLELEKLFDSSNIIVYIHTLEPDFVEVVSYVDSEDSMYYPVELFIDTFADTTPIEAQLKLDTTDHTLW